MPHATSARITSGMSFLNHCRPLRSAPPRANRAAGTPGCRGRKIALESLSSLVLNQSERATSAYCRLSSMRLTELGWDDMAAKAFEAYAATPGVEPARVIIEFNYIYRVWAKDGELDATASGRLKHHAGSRSELPAVGDWVVIRRRRDASQAAIVAVLPRRSWFSRKMAGTVTDEQVVAANVDVVFIVMALDGDFSLRRLERYLLLTRESGAAPVVLVSKTDMATILDVQATVVSSVIV